MVFVSSSCSHTSSGNAFVTSHEKRYIKFLRHYRQWLCETSVRLMTFAVHLNTPVVSLERVYLDLPDKVDIDEFSKVEL